MSYLDPYEDEEEASSNYFARQWRGQNSLPFAYWVNGSILTTALAIGVAAAGTALQESKASLQLIAGVSLAMIVVLWAAWAWSAVGIWRSASRHPYRGGSGAWAMVAKGVIILGCLGMMARAPGFFLQARELGQLAMGSDPIGRSASLTVPRSGVVQVDGFLTQGFADRVAEMLKSTPDVHTLVLNSPGGRTLEGERIAALVKSRGLDTMVETECSSACVMPFLAGRNRRLGADAQLGFHQPSFPGASAADHQDGIRQFRKYLVEAGVDAAFSDQALSAAPDDMWYPALPALIEAGVITGLGADAVAADHLRSAKSLNAHAPTAIDDLTVLTKVEANGSALVYFHELQVPAGELNLARMRQDLPAAIRKDACSSEAVAFLIKSGAVYRYSYNDSRGVSVLQVEIKDC